MKRKLRTYFSAVLLLCLVVQFVPFGLMHSHEEHHTDEVVHSSAADQCHSELHSTNLTDDSNLSFESVEDCDLCELLLALNDQVTGFNGTVDYILDFTERNANNCVPRSEIEETTLSTQGRAPPVV